MTRVLLLAKDDDDNDTFVDTSRLDENDNEDISTTLVDSNLNDNDDVSSQQQILPVVLSVVAFTTFWPLLAYLRFENPLGYFDIDTFLALKGIMSDGVTMDTYGNEIIELPSLSPAEQLVGAFFGPPSRKELYIYNDSRSTVLVSSRYYDAPDFAFHSQANNRFK